MKSVSKFSVNKKNRNWIKFLIGAVALLFFIFVLNIFTPGIKNSFYSLSAPIQKVFWGAGKSSSSFFGSILNAGSLASENDNLKSENQKLSAQVASLKSIEQGNQAQSDVSASCQNTGFKLKMAGVVGLDSDILSINKGSADGISVGMPVISQQNVLFGKVFKVYKNFSDVMLISNKNSVINVKIQQPDSGLISTEDGTSVVTPEIDGVVKGNGGLNAYLDLIPINSNINLKDILDF